MMRVVPRNAFSPELCGILIEANENENCVYLTATNPECSIQRRVMLHVECGGSFVMDARFMREILSKLGGEEVTFCEVKERIVEIRSGSCTYTVPVLEGRVYPRPQMPFPKDTLAVRGLGKLYGCIAAVALNNEKESVLCGIHMEITPKTVKMMACNRVGFAIAAQKMDTGGKLSFTLPKTALLCLVSAIGDDDILEVGIVGRDVVFMKETLLFSVRFLHHEYVDVNRLLQYVQPICTAKLEYDGLKRKLLDICDIAMLGKEKSYVRMTFKENVLEAATENDFGSSCAEISCVRLEGEGKYTYYYQAQQLKDLLKCFASAVMLRLDKRGYLVAFDRSNQYVITPMTKEAVYRQQQKVAAIRMKQQTNTLKEKNAA